jgi:3-methyl-2-oxobutanoate hydroxymethyltransferase
MLVLTAAVRRGTSTAILVGDLPLGSYETSDDQAITTAVRYVKEVGCDMVKIERGGTSVERARAIVGAGISVIGHVGLTPQTETSLGGLVPQGSTAEQGREIFEEALALQDAGCDALVLEAIPTQLTALIMQKMRIPVIGIGAGAGTDGQVLVLHDVLGLTTGRVPRFVPRYGDVRDEMVAGVKAFVGEVSSGRYPQTEYTYSMSEDEAHKLEVLLRGAGTQPD